MGMTASRRSSLFASATTPTMEYQLLSPAYRRDAEASSYRTRAAEDVVRHTLVDDRHLGCIGIILASKIAPQQDRCLKDFEVVGAQDIYAGDEGRAARSWLIALDRWRGFEQVARKRRDRSKSSFSVFREERLSDRLISCTKHSSAQPCTQAAAHLHRTAEHYPYESRDRSSSGSAGCAPAAPPPPSTPAMLRPVRRSVLLWCENAPHSCRRRECSAPILRAYPSAPAAKPGIRPKRIAVKTRNRQSKSQHPEIGPHRQHDGRPHMPHQSHQRSASPERQNNSQHASCQCQHRCFP